MNYCSMKCRKEYNKITLNCTNCGKEVVKNRTRYGDLSIKAFCSHKCSTDYNINKKLIPCSYCGKEVWRTKSSYDIYNHTFCSIKCNHNFYNKHIQAVCEVCGKEYEVKYSKKDTSKYCSNNCRIKGTQNTSLTKPHIKIIELLEDLNIDYKNEKSVDQFSIDIFLPEHNLSIEIMGDYWHCNPTIYNYPKYEKQKYSLEKDPRKEKHIFEKLNHHSLFLWESDINKNIEICKYLILYYIKNNGILKNYDSFNYQLNNKELLLKENITNRIKLCN